MKSAVASCLHPSRLLRILLLGGLVLLAGGCAHLSKPSVGISGSNDDTRRPGY